MPADTPDPLVEEIRQLAVELARSKDGAVQEFAAWFADEYRTLLDGDVMLQGVDVWEFDEPEVQRRSETRVRNARVQLRDSLRRLLAWARETGRMPS